MDKVWSKGSQKQKDALLSNMDTYEKELDKINSVQGTLSKSQKRRFQRMRAAFAANPAHTRSKIDLSTTEKKRRDRNRKIDAMSQIILVNPEIPRAVAPSIERPFSTYKEAVLSPIYVSPWSLLGQASTYVTSLAKCKVPNTPRQQSLMIAALAVQRGITSHLRLFSDDDVDSIELLARTLPPAHPAGFQSERPDPPIPLTKDGDVEANPGPLTPSPDIVKCVPTDNTAITSNGSGTNPTEFGGGLATLIAAPGTRDNWAQVHLDAHILRTTANTGGMWAVVLYSSPIAIGTFNTREKLPIQNLLDAVPLVPIVYHASRIVTWEVMVDIVTGSTFPRASDNQTANIDIVITRPALFATYVTYIPIDMPNIIIDPLGEWVWTYSAQVSSNVLPRMVQRTDIVGIDPLTAPLWITDYEQPDPPIVSPAPVFHFPPNMDQDAATPATTSQKQSTEREHSERPSARIYKHIQQEHLDTPATVLRAAVYWSSVGAGAETVWTGETLNGTEAIIKSSPSKQATKAALNRRLFELYPSSEQVMWSQHSDYQAYLAATKNSRMHALNGNINADSVDSATENSSGYAAYLAAMWNTIMHLVNGNTEAEMSAQLLNLLGPCSAEEIASANRTAALMDRASNPAMFAEKKITAHRKAATQLGLTPGKCATIVHVEPALKSQSPPFVPLVTPLAPPAPAAPDLSWLPVDEDLLEKDSGSSESSSSSDETFSVTPSIERLMARMNNPVVISLGGKACIMSSTVPLFAFYAMNNIEDVAIYARGITEMADAADLDPSAQERKKGNGMGQGSSAPPKTREERAHNFSEMVDRITRKLDSPYGHAGVAVWSDAHGARSDIVAAVTDKMWKKGWENNKSVTHGQWAILALRANIPRTKIAYRFATLLFSSQEQAIWATWFMKELDVPPVSSWSAVEKALWGKKMHADNGNTALILDMSALKALPTTWDVAASMEDAPPPSGIAMLPSIAAIPKRLNVALDMPSAYTTVVADNVTAVGAVLTVPSQTIELNSTRFQPRSYIDDDFAPQLLADHARVQVISPVLTRTNELKYTDFNGQINTISSKQDFYLGRLYDTTFGGFLGADIVTLAKTSTPYGMDPTVWLIRLMAIADMAVLRGAPRMTTLAPAEYTMWQHTHELSPPNDPIPGTFINTRINVSPDPTDPHYDQDSPNASFFADTPGFGGTISFHLTAETVNPAKVADNFYVPTGFCVGDDIDAVGDLIALLVDIVTDSGKRSVFDEVAFADGEGAIEEIPFLYTASATSISSGKKNINVILPRRGSAVNPTNYQQALDKAWLIIHAGPIPFGAVLANQVMAINAIGEAYIEYSLCDFCNSWYTNWDTSTILKFYQKLGGMCDMDAYEPLARSYQDLTSMVYFAPTVENWDNFYGSPALNTPAWQNVYFASATAGSDYIPGYHEDRYYYVTDCDWAAWNKVALMLAHANPNRGSPAPEWLRPRIAGQYLRARSLAYASMYQLMFRMEGYSSAQWQNVLDETRLVGIAGMLREYFLYTFEGTLPIPAPKAQALRSWCAKAFGWAPPAIEVAGQKLSVLDFRSYSDLPDYVTYIENTNYVNFTDAVMPLLLPDLWFQLFSKALPRCYSSYPLPGSNNYAFGLEEGEMSFFQPTQAFFGARLADQMIRNYCDDLSSPYYTDAHQWNQKLLYEFVDEPHIVDWTGQPIDVLDFGVNGKFALAERSSPNNTQFTGPLCAPRFRYTSAWWPTLAADGRYVFIVATPPDVDNVRAAQSTDVEGRLVKGLSAWGWAIGRLKQGSSTPASYGQGKSPWTSIMAARIASRDKLIEEDLKSESPQMPPDTEEMNTAFTT
jgi:hypothetical protein